ncbi:glycosyl transferase [Pseudoalteromonas sp. A25]|uniref:glycosyltransferase n=1 Tax=Pseudoalteromonas sp. A25 TaxID=116092 RepID=UPI001260B82E|nr:glycosyltransferase [Pseudoalteromonas sp. A25]BBN81663.1 glycosyl transferase [Pseudoalteromonas sp. A25]
MKFIVFGEDWGGLPSSTQHLFKHLSKSHNVHWVNSVGMRRPKMNKTDFVRLCTKAWAFLTKSRQHAKRLNDHNLKKVSSLAILPWHNNKLVNLINKALWLLQLGENKDQEPIIYWISVPTAMSFIKLRRQDKLIYYCGDEFGALAGVDHDMVAPFEQTLIERAHLIYVVSEKLKRKMPQSKTKLLTHGVDFELFNHPTPANRMLSKHQRKVGFYGSINTWLDVALLIQLAKQRPHYELYLIGAVINYTSEIETLFSLPNVIHIDAVDHKTLPSFSQHWHVSIMPFLDNEQIRACNPLKLKEYLAAGTPIVTTHFPAALQFKQTLFIANDVDSFIEAVDMAMSVKELPDLNWQYSQAQLAAPHSWHSKAQQVSQTLSLLP